MTSEKNQSKPFKEDQAKAKPQLKETSDLEAKLAKLEAEVSAEKAGRAASANLPVPVPVSAPVDKTDLSPASRSEPRSKKESSKAASRSLVDSEHMPHINMALFWTIAIGSILLANAPGLNILLTPVNQFVVTIHESSHAIIALLTGGHPAMTTVPDGLGHAGLTQANGGWLFFTAQAGYIGTALFGCFLIWLSQFPKYSKYILMGVGALMILSSLIFVTPSIFSAAFISGLLSMMWGLAMGGALIYLGKKLSPFLANIVVLFLAVQTALNSLSLVWFLIPHSLGLAGAGFSDATIMQQFFFLPAIFWALWWIALSMVMFFFTLKFTYGKAVLNRKKKDSKT